MKIQDAPVPARNDNQLFTAIDQVRRGDAAREDALEGVQPDAAQRGRVGSVDLVGRFFG